MSPFIADAWVLKTLKLGVFLSLFYKLGEPNDMANS